MQRELLQLFLRQADETLAGLDVNLSDRQARIAVHTLHGAALAVGAAGIAAAAGALDEHLQRLEAAGEPPSRAALAAFRQAVEEGRPAILDVLGRLDPGVGTASGSGRPD